MIPLDKCQMKSFENINILIKVKLFCLKNVLFLEKKLLFEKKKGFMKKILKIVFFWKKENWYLKQKIVCEKKLYYFWHQKVQKPISPKPNRQHLNVLHINTCCLKVVDRPKATSTSS